MMAKKRYGLGKEESPDGATYDEPTVDEVEDPTPNERLTGDEAPEVVDRHVARYEKAISLTGRQGGVWWDIGCGTGYGTDLLPGDEVVGLDRDPPSGDGYLTTDFRQGAWSSEAPDPDVVICIETLEHLGPREQNGLVAEIAQRLDPEGVCVVACPVGDGGPNPANPHHRHEPTHKELRRLLSRHFHSAPIELDHYESTSGPAVQAFAVCQRPIK